MNYATKRILSIITLSVSLVMLISFGIAFGAEEVVTGEITDVVQAVDKNGESYTRLIVTVERTLEGSDYQVGLPFMAFGSQAEPAAALQAGDVLKAICQTRLYQGRESFTIVKILE